MFYAPALMNTAVAAPNRSASDFGLERFMRDAFGGFAPAAYEMEEDEQSWTLRMDVPGVAKNHLVVQLSGNTVEVQTDKESPRKVRALYELPGPIDADKTEAHLQDGVLTLKLAKTESAIPRRIKVH